MTLSFLDQGAGEPLLLVHGFPLDHAMWRGQIDVLARRRRVIAVDLRGFGQSSPPPDFAGEAYPMSRHADDLAELLDALQLPGPIDLGGLSMGGYVAFEFHRRHRRRLRRLILCDTRSQADTAEAAEQRRKTADLVLQAGVQSFAEGMLAKLFSERTRERRPDVVRETLEVMLRCDPRSVAGALRGMAVRDDAGVWLDEIDCPCLVVCGAEDAITPPEVMRPLAQRLGADYVEIAEAGHMAPLEDPAAVNRAIGEFLDATTETSGGRS